LAAMIDSISAGLPAYLAGGVYQEQYSGVEPDGNLTLNPDFSLDRRDYRVRLAGEEGLLRTQVDNLVASQYSSRGLCADGSLRSDIQPGEVTIVAAREEEVFGTITLRKDSDAGLLADSLYRREIDTLRVQGRRLCEVTRLAVDAQSSCMEVMASLFNVAFVLAKDVHDRTDLVAEVHPRHVGFYQRTMGYRIAGPERVCIRVGAPAVLMHLPLEFAGSQIRELAGTCVRHDRNLYRLFLPAEEQEALFENLTLPVAEKN